MSTRRRLSASFMQPRQYSLPHAATGALAQLVATIALALSILVAATAVSIGFALAQASSVAESQALTRSHDADLSLIAALLLCAVIAMGLLSTVATRFFVRGPR